MIEITYHKDEYSGPRDTAVRLDGNRDSGWKETVIMYPAVYFFLDNHQSTRGRLVR